MLLSIASGKGGTGKTTIAVNLALSLDRPVQLLDCDVEEPNAHLFLNPEISDVAEIARLIPDVDSEKCSLCGKCSQICEFHAIIRIRPNVLVFPELCHSCAGCWLVCPEGAILQKKRKIGVIESGRSGDIEFVQGKLELGEASASPLIRQVKKRANRSRIVIVDAPPGTSCPVIESVKASDFVILVTEPTPFGLNDLKLAAEMVRAIGLPFGVIINRANSGDDSVLDYCAREQIPILMEIENDRQIAEAYSRGIALVHAFPAFKARFMELFRQIQRRLAP